MTKIEQVARGMWAARRAFGEKNWPNLPQLEAWDDARPLAKEIVLAEARAALVVLRDISKEKGSDLYDAMMGFVGGSDHGLDHENMINVWHDLFDAVVAEPT
jgi:hypothetical protein